LPTPLERLLRLAAELGLASLWVKRDDCTGLGLGGNKLRKLEFDLAAAREAGADCVVCDGVVQSNTARQVAAACARLGIECHLGIMHGRLPATEPGYDATGNIMLDRLFGAIIHDIPWDEDRNRRLRGLADELRASGRRVYFVPYGASDALGAMGYVLAAEEIIRDCPDVAWIVHASGSAGTQAGLLAGLLALEHAARVIGIDVDSQAARVTADVCRVGRAAAELLGVADRWCGFTPAAVPACSPTPPPWRDYPADAGDDGGCVGAVPLSLRVDPRPTVADPPWMKLPGRTGANHVMAGLDPAIHAGTLPWQMAEPGPMGIRITPCRRTYVLRDDAFSSCPSPGATRGSTRASPPAPALPTQWLQASTVPVGMAGSSPAMTKKAPSGRI
jgi:1-aminocyclopropane-1-carboxylate deaminase/D-cysteine desulfhydrase-like pyridoxal-dependent ACC family enzyme